MSHYTRYTEVSWGACYKQVPPIRRVGGFNHSLSILGCFSKRLHSEVKGWGGNGLDSAKTCLAQLQLKIATGR